MAAKLSRLLLRAPNLGKKGDIVRRFAREPLFSSQLLKGLRGSDPQIGERWLLCGFAYFTSILRDIGSGCTCGVLRSKPRAHVLRRAQAGCKRRFRVRAEEVVAGEEEAVAAIGALLEVGQGADVAVVELGH